jgi:pimeloyl-[acyl-carrier protein] methyl ester esterase
MSLYIEQSGQGPDLVMIHGWGAHGGIWSELVENLDDHFRVTVIDLPGSGRSSPMDKKFSLESVIEEIKTVIPRPATWLGWSLGALIVMALAVSAKERVEKMILVGSSPCFVKKPDWQCATSEGVLNNFAEALKSNYRKTLIRFLSLQMGDSEEARRVLRIQREMLFQFGEPDIATLEEMLVMLQQADLRDQLDHLEQPTLLIHGSRDTLAPLAAAEYMQAHLKNSALLDIEGAGHIPFLTHSKLCAQNIKEFCLSTIAS